VSDGVESFRNVIKVTTVKSSDGDSSVHGHVDGVLLTELVDHILVKTSEGKHANLRGDVIPVVNAAVAFKGGLKSRSHLSHSGGHEFKVSVPHLGELFISKDDVDDSSSMDRRVRVDGSGDLLNARVNDVAFSNRRGNNGEKSSTFTVDTEVLGERLEKHDVVSVLLEKSEGVSILLEITGSETLVSGIKAGEKLLSLDDFEDISPLARSRINTSRVVRADMEHDERMVLASLKIFEHTVKVESLSLLIKVSVRLVVVSNELSESSVNGPGLLGDHNINVFVRVPVSEEGKSESERSSSGERLSSSNSVFIEGFAFISESELLGFVDEGVNTLDSSVLVIHIGSKNSLFGDSNAREDVRLAVVISVGSHTEEALLGVSVLLEGVVETKDRISRGIGKRSPSGEKSVLNAEFVGVSESSGEHLFVIYIIVSFNLE
jgi:hypothetical protein